MWNKEIGMVQKYNEVNGTEYQIIIDNFNNSFYIADKYGNMVTDTEAHKVWEYYGWEDEIEAGYWEW